MSKTAATIGIVVLLAIAAGAYILAMDSDKSANTTTIETTVDTSKAVETNTITFTDDGFSPSSIKVKAGSIITVKNDSSRPLKFSSDPHPEHTIEPELNLDTLSAGKSTTFTASKAGAYAFHDHLNENHTGTLKVE